MGDNCVRSSTVARTRLYPFHAVGGSGKTCCKNPDLTLRQLWLRNRTDPPPGSKLVHLRNATRSFRASSFGETPLCDHLFHTGATPIAPSGRKIGHHKTPIFYAYKELVTHFGSLAIRSSCPCHESRGADTSKFFDRKN